MKKILLFAYLCLSLVLLGNEGFRVGTISSFSPAPLACEHPGVVETVLLRQVTIHFSCGVSIAQQDRIMDFIGRALDSMPSGALPRAEVLAFSDLDQGVSAEAAWLRTRGYTPSVQSLKAAWLEEGFLGQTFKGAVFLYVGHNTWGRDPAVASLTVLHEMHHLLQYQLVGSNDSIPLWLQEGGADEFALSQLAARGLPAPDRSTSPYQCNYGLAALEYERPDVPLACAYVEGAQAVRLLVDRYGQAAYYQLFRAIGSESSFPAAFSHIYGLSLGDFYQRFEGSWKSTDDSAFVLGFARLAP